MHCHSVALYSRPLRRPRYAAFENSDIARKIKTLYHIAAHLKWGVHHQEIIGNLMIALPCFSLVIVYFHRLSSPFSPFQTRRHSVCIRRILFDAFDDTRRKGIHLEGALHNLRRYIRCVFQIIPGHTPLLPHQRLTLTWDPQAFSEEFSAFKMPFWWQRCILLTVTFGRFSWSHSWGCTGKLSQMQRYSY